MKSTGLWIAALLLFGSVPMAWAQDGPPGAGKLEIGGFPIGGSFLVGEDYDRQVNFNVYSAGANLA